MKKAALILLFLGLTTSALYAEAAEARSSYLVGVRSRPELPILTKAFDGREVQEFESFDGFAVEMTPAEAEALRRSPGIRFVEPDYEKHLYIPRSGTPARDEASVGSVSGEATRGQLTPWGIERIQASKVWGKGRGKSIRVAVIDTGIDYGHPDLAALYKGGYDFANKDADPMDDHYHGTHVAGTVAAIDNGIGVVGVAPEIDLYGLKVLRPTSDGSASGATSDIIKAIDWSIQNQMHVVNLSLGSNDFSQAENEAMQRAWSSGILVVAASGNDHPKVTFVGYPAGYQNVVAVGAVDDDDVVASFSQRGTAMTVAAPGISVFSTMPVGSAEVSEIEIGSLVVATDLFEGSPLGTISGSWVFCGLGKKEEIPSSVQGKIAVIRRGELTFRDKAKNAKDAGARAVVILNNTTGTINGTLRPKDEKTGLPMYPEDANYVFPVTVGMTMAEGEKLLAMVPSPITVSARLDDYGNLQGTSMASPHVAGVAAVLWSLSPHASNADIKSALTLGAEDLGSYGWDEVYGFGLVDAISSAKVLAPHLFSNPGRRRPVSRP